MVELWHRAKDIMFNDKTSTSIEMLKIRERHISLLKKLHDIINADEKPKTRITRIKIESEYNELISEYGGIIEEVTRVGRVEKMHYLFEDGDFSAYRIKKLIREGEEDAEQILTQRKNRNN